MNSMFLSVDPELTLHYEQVGSGDINVVLVPGWTMSTRVFERQLDYFSLSSNYRITALDPRAHGLSSKTPGGHFYEQHGRDICAFIETLNLDNIVLCGWSFGTLAALSYVNQFGTERLSGFIMLDGPPRATGENNKEEWVTYSHGDKDGMRELFTVGRLRDSHQANIEFANWMLEFPTKEHIDWVLAITSQTPDNSAVLLNATAEFLDYRNDLILLAGTLPTMYVVRKDKGEVVLNWAKRNTPSARVESFGGHMMFWERADAFNKILEDFLEGCRRCSFRDKEGEMPTIT